MADFLCGPESTPSNAGVLRPAPRTVIPTAVSEILPGPPKLHPTIGKHRLSNTTINARNSHLSTSFTTLPYGCPKGMVNINNLVHNRPPPPIKSIKSAFPKSMKSAFPKSMNSAFPTAFPDIPYPGGGPPTTLSAPVLSPLQPNPNAAGQPSMPDPQAFGLTPPPPPDDDEEYMGGAVQGVTYSVIKPADMREITEKDVLALDPDTILENRMDKFGGFVGIFSVLAFGYALGVHIAAKRGYEVGSEEFGKRWVAFTRYVKKKLKLLQKNAKKFYDERIQGKKPKEGDEDEEKEKKAAAEKKAKEQSEQRPMLPRIGD